MESRHSGLARAVGAFIERVGSGEFTSFEAIAALPAFKPQAIRGHLNWLISTGKLVSCRHRKGNRLSYHVRRENEVRGFYCSAELITAMRRVSALPRTARSTIASEIKTCKDWVRGIVDRAHNSPACSKY